jgi:hypothetical protein
MGASSENRPIVKDAVVTAIEENLSSPERSIAARAAELAVLLDALPYRRLWGRDGFWGEISTEIVEKNIDSILSLVGSSRAAGNILFRRGKLSFSQFVEKYGVEGLFSTSEVALADGMVRIPHPAGAMVNYALGYRGNDDSAILEDALAGLGHLLSEVSTPWFDASRIRLGHSVYWGSYRPMKVVSDIRGDILFGAIAIALVLLELEESFSIEQSLDKALADTSISGGSEFSRLYQAIKSARGDQGGNWQQLAINMELTDRQIFVLDNWTKGTIYWVKKHEAGAVNGV